MPQPKPTSRQLNCLKSLAARTGGTFAYPKTRAQASAEIKRLLEAKPSSLDDRRDERSYLELELPARRGDAATVREFDTTGYGADARWTPGSGAWEE
jgi:hypothetical protein